jgi:hypothetical protein
MKDPTSRYRIENGTHCVDVKISNFEQLFDNRDPAPFRERDLDPGLAEYLRDASEDLAGKEQFRVVFWLDEPCPQRAIEQALRAHFEDELERIRRRRRRHRRIGQVALLLAVVLIGVLVWLSIVFTTLLPGPFGAVLREGLVISSWVVMWRPVEVLIHDWIPVRHERKTLTRLLEAPIEVRVGSGLPAAHTGQG